MKKTLAEIFKDQCVTDVDADHIKAYEWYLDEKKLPIGISKGISAIERDLIELNYVRIHMNTPADAEKLLWLNFLIGKEPFQLPINERGSQHLHFIFFFHDFDPNLQLEFEALVHSFNAKLKVFFLEATYGVMLNLSTDDTETNEEMQDFLHASKQDFSNMLIFYQTIRYQIDKRLPQTFKAELELFKQFKDSNFSLMKHKDIFLNYMVSSDVVSQHPIFGDWFKHIFLVDADLLRVVKCYLETGFNVTTGAKRMHMHRNTFMNKLDRFIDVTKLDVKNFDEATIAYLLIRLRKDV
ncbi:MAG: helix-turn-helix domain-containing protein [Defluviitaleaceae bacterium]|nr:helix-turn-helix domain-containing protein [Defluviitaleaceae bacterium]